ncbi:hypothetical protein J2X46_003164 [Nocardioides sp. BE266]|uniref:restriction endonuclease n=1 Tax=Nocardioides sp. BE266 TaxID=2817725 RepID=UPI00285718FF|nr:restriction endonuclease [Nocardioides sp. BE266]MDR7254171.1 hypothetical protein [Nocardioides sp. BE266]
MVTINWERESGDRIEEFVAAALVMRHGAGCRVTPSRGDGGMDVKLPLANGRWWVVQVKRYSGPLTSRQETSIEKSYGALLAEIARTGLEVERWTLATPWDPTRERLGWLEGFDRSPDGLPATLDWMGRVSLDGLAADCPQLVDYYFGDGAERLTSLMALALKSSITLSGSGPEQLLEAAMERMNDLAKAMEEIDPFYRYEISAIDAIPDHSKLAEHGEGAAMVRFGTGPDGRAVRLRIVPMSDLSAHFRPIRHKVRLHAAPGSGEEAALRDFAATGKPFANVRAEVVKSVGPPGATLGGQSLLSLYVEEHDHLPPMELVLLDDDEVEVAALKLEQARGNLSPAGNGFWMATSDIAGAVDVELKHPGEAREITLGVTFNRPADVPVASLVPVVKFANALAEGGWLLIRAVAGRPLVGPFGRVCLDPSTAKFWEFADLYVRLQAHTFDVVRLPDLSTVSPDDLVRLQFTVRALDGDAPEGIWATQVMQANGIDWPAGDFEGRLLREITMPLAGVDVALHKMLQQRFHSCRVDPNAVLPAGATVCLVPGESNTMSMHALNFEDGMEDGLWTIESE